MTDVTNEMKQALAAHTRAAHAVGMTVLPRGTYEQRAWQSIADHIRTEQLYAKAIKMMARYPFLTGHGAIEAARDERVAPTEEIENTRVYAMTTKGPREFRVKGNRVQSR